MGPRKASGNARATASTTSTTNTTTKQQLPPFPFSNASASSSPSSSTQRQSITAMPPAASNNATAAAASAGKSSATPNAKASKSKIAVLKLSPKSLAKFPHETPAPSRVKSEASATPSAATPAKSSEDSKKDAASETPAPTAAAAAATPSGADSNAASTPAATANGMLAPPPNAARRKGVPGPKPGMKRTASQLDAGGVPKPRGKPGPKKKARIGENGELLNGTAPTAPKLGPKANQGAINACLRALDRSGAPCRKWNRKPFSVRSFTGYSWGAGSYAAPLRKGTGADGFEGDVKSDESSTGEGSGENPNVDSSAVMSEKSTSGVEVDTPVLAVGGVDSPATTAAVAAAS